MQDTYYNIGDCFYLEGKIRKVVDLIHIDIPYPDNAIFYYTTYDEAQNQFPSFRDGSFNGTHAMYNTIKTSCPNSVEEAISIITDINNTLNVGWLGILSAIGLGMIISNQIKKWQT